MPSLIVSVGTLVLMKLGKPPFDVTLTVTLEMVDALGGVAHLDRIFSSRNDRTV